MLKIIKYVMLDILRSRIVITYTLLLLVISLGVFSLEEASARAMLSIQDIALIVVPLVSIIFSTIYVYNSTEFIELLLSQPLKRNQLWLSIFIGLSASLCLAFLIGIGIPVLIFGAGAAGLTLLGTGLLLTLIFISLALLSAVLVRDKARGIGVAILLWFFFTVIFDALILFALFQFADYPVEKLMVILSSLNPIDLARIAILLKLDVAALMGVSGAVFREVFGNITGSIYALLIMICWVIVPLFLSIGRFHKKDL